MIIISKVITIIIKIMIISDRQSDSGLWTHTSCLCVAPFDLDYGARSSIIIVCACDFDATTIHRKLAAVCNLRCCALHKSSQQLCELEPTPFELKTASKTSIMQQASRSAHNRFWPATEFHFKRCNWKWASWDSKRRKWHLFCCISNLGRFGTWETCNCEQANKRFNL